MTVFLKYKISRAKHTLRSETGVAHPQGLNLLVSSHNIFLGRPWTQSSEDVASSLHQRLKYIANGRLVTVKAKETITMMRNVVKPYIKTEVVKDKDLHAFEIVNVDLISEHTIKRWPELSYVVKMDAKYMIEFDIPPTLVTESGVNNTWKWKMLINVLVWDISPVRKDYLRMAKIKKREKIGLYWRKRALR